MNDVLASVLSDSAESTEQSRTRMGWLLGILVLTVVAGGARLYPTSHEPITTGASPIGQSMPASTDAAHPAASVVHAVIKGSLYQTVSDAGFGLPLAIQLRDIFSDKVDFRRDLRAGDWFTAIYAPGRPSSMTAGTRRIIAAELSIRGHIYRAFRFPESEVVDEYFTEAGQSLHRSILRAPLNYSHIASIFSYHRLDPVLGIIRPHFGVDYAAPMGTPIGAAADGYIRFLGVDGGYGNLIVITSFGRYETYYAHLLRFAPGLHAGSRVQQGHVIGYVGESGEATGPHLHYGIKVNGRWSDPLTVPLPDAKPLPKAERAEFQQQVATLLAQLQSAGMVQGPPRSTAMRVADSRTKKPESAARPDGIAH